MGGSASDGIQRRRGRDAKHTKDKPGLAQIDASHHRYNETQGLEMVGNEIAEFVGTNRSKCLEEAIAWAHTVVLEPFGIGGGIDTELNLLNLAIPICVVAIDSK